MSRLNDETARRHRRAAGMPETWWGNTILGTYLFGYVYFVIDAGVRSWPHLPFFDWWYFMGWHAMAQSFWPLWVTLAWFEVQL